MQAAQTRTELFTERVELLPIYQDSPSSPSPEQLAAFQKKFEVKDKELAEQLIYALRATERHDADGISDLEQLAKNISESGHEEHKLEVLFRLLDSDRSGSITTSSVDNQLRKVPRFLCLIIWISVHHFATLTVLHLINNSR